MQECKHSHSFTTNIIILQIKQHDERTMSFSCCPCGWGTAETLCPFHRYPKHTQTQTRTHGTQMQFMAGIREFAAQCSGRRDEVITSISTPVGAAIKSYLSNRARQWDLQDSCKCSRVLSLSPALSLSFWHKGTLVFHPTSHQQQRL